MVAGCFGGADAPFGFHDADQDRAFLYLQCCGENGMTWEQARAQIEDYLNGRGSTQAAIATHIKMAEEKLQPWLG